MAVRCEELSWWSIGNETLIGTVGRDRVDDDYLLMVLARDRIGRFRCAAVKAYLKSREIAERRLWVEMVKVVDDGEVAAFGEQGDETNSPLDPFEVSPTVSRDRLHPYFVHLSSYPGSAPARKAISELALWLAPKDPHFVREFQTNGFDQRLWELFLWAALREFMLEVQQLEAPDFHCTAPGIAFTVEATTVAPSEKGPLAEHPDPHTPEEISAFLRDYMAIKFGGALTAKLNKRNAAGESYWSREETREKPFVIALADFHAPATEDGPGSMVFTQSALWEYLYGLRATHRFDEEGQLVIEYVSVAQHTYGTKTIPSNFFGLAEAENVSAVLFSNAGTIAKFDRMGAAAGYGASGHRYFRRGFMHDPDPNATMGLPFAVEVGVDGYEEYWAQEVQVFHNPNALRPLPNEAMVGATHHRLVNGQFESLCPKDAVLSSMTMIVGVEGRDAETHT